MAWGVDSDLPFRPKDFEVLIEFIPCRNANQKGGMQVNDWGDRKETNLCSGLHAGHNVD